MNEPAIDLKDSEALYKLLKTSVRDMGFSERAKNTLLHSGIKTMLELVSITPDYLVLRPSVGPRALLDIALRLEALGLNFETKIRIDRERAYVTKPEIVGALGQTNDAILRLYDGELG